MNDDFFAGVEQVDFYYGDYKSKTPLFYPRARGFTAVFPAKLWEVRKLLPDRRFEPAQLFPGITAVQLAAFEYYEASIPPYNEFAVCVPLNAPQFMKVPGYNLLRQMLRMEYDLYFHHIAVTDEIALTGREYGYPKVLGSVDFTDTEQWIDCEVAEGGQNICTLRGRKIPAPHSKPLKFFCHMYHDRQPHFAEGKLNGRHFGMSFNPSGAELSLGSHPLARQLQKLILSPRPLMSMYVPDFQMILYGNEHLSIPLLRHVLADGMRLPIPD